MDDWNTIKQKVYTDVGDCIAWEQVQGTGKRVQFYPSNGGVTVKASVTDHAGTFLRRNVFSEQQPMDAASVADAARRAHTAANTADQEQIIPTESESFAANLLEVMLICCGFRP